MTAYTQESVERLLATCNDRNEVDTMYREVVAEDEVLVEASKRRALFSNLKTARLKELRAAELAPWIDEAKRWQSGDKVYFGRPYRSDWFDLEACQLIKGPRIKAGQWCRVYANQTRAKRIWLCLPGKPATRANVIDTSFSYSDVCSYKISRTELELRK